MNDTFAGLSEADLGPLRAATVSSAMAARDATRRSAIADEPDVAEPGQVGYLDLFREATRAPGDPVSFAVAAALRSSDRHRRRYARLVSQRAGAHSPMAAAARSEGTRRLIGSHSLNLMAADMGMPPILVISPTEEDAPPPVAIEVMGRADGVQWETTRVALPAAIRGHVILPLDPARPESVLLAVLLARPDTALWLF